MIEVEAFTDLYKGTSVIDYKELFFSEPQSDVELLEKYLPSKLWRLNNLYTIVNKYGKRIPFNMNYAQHKVYAQSLIHPRLIILKSRQQGISTFWLVSFFDDCMFNNDFSVGLMAQGEEAAQTLLERTTILWDELDASIKQLFNLRVVKENTKEFAFSSGSTIFIRTSFRSATLQRLHISEYGKIANANPKRAKETKTGTLQAIAPGNTAAIESTAEGDNEFKWEWDRAELCKHDIAPTDFYPVFLSWVDDPSCMLDRFEEPTKESLKYFDKLEHSLGITLKQEQKNFWIAKKRELKEDMSQEYPGTPEEAFLATRDGTYYAKAYISFVRGNKREITNLYDPNLLTIAVFDLGMNDDMAVGIFQFYHDGIRQIDEFYDSGEMIAYYCNQLDDLPYDVDSIVLPVDGRVTDLTSGKTREEAFHDCGYHDTYILAKTKSVQQEIEQVRSHIKHFYFVDPTKCQYTIECITNYTKEWDKTREVWKDRPLHNQHSHGADMIRYAVKFYENYYSSDFNVPENTLRTSSSVDL